MERLTPLDAWFLAVEDGIDHMHMALVAILEGRCPTLAELRADVDGRLDRIPRYRQRVVAAPLGLASSVWVDDPKFDIANHVRTVGVRAPGDEAALAEVVSEVISEELDRSRPLWDITVVQGLTDGGWAAIIRVHHSLTDGVGGQELFAIMVDLERDADPPTPSTWEPPPMPARSRLFLAGAVGLVRPLHTARLVARAVRSPVATLKAARDRASGFLAFRHDLPPTRATILNGPLGPARCWTVATASMADVDAIRTIHHVTVNDIALTAIAGGLTDLLTAHGEEVADRDVRSLVPVSLRVTDRDGALHNHVAAMIADLPVGMRDPVERLHVMHRRMQALKTSHETEATAFAVEASEHLPWLPIAATFAVAVRFVHTFGQRNVNAVTTNVPGPPFPLYWMGRRILRSYPVTPIGESVRIGVAIHSYDGLLSFGITSDRAALPDAAPVVAGIERDLAALAAGSRARRTIRPQASSA